MVVAVNVQRHDAKVVRRCDLDHVREAHLREGEGEGDRVRVTRQGRQGEGDRVRATG